MKVRRERSRGMRIYGLRPLNAIGSRPTVKLHPFVIPRIDLLNNSSNLYHDIVSNHRYVRFQLE